MPKLNIHVGETLFHEFAFSDIGTWGATFQPILSMKAMPKYQYRINLKNGNKYTFFSENPEYIHQLSPSLMEAMQKQEDIDFYFEEKVNPKYTEEAEPGIENPLRLQVFVGNKKVFEAPYGDIVINMKGGMGEHSITFTIRNPDRYVDGWGDANTNTDLSYHFNVDKSEIFRKYEEVHDVLEGRSVAPVRFDAELNPHLV